MNGKGSARRPMAIPTTEAENELDAHVWKWVAIGQKWGATRRTHGSNTNGPVPTSNTGESKCGQSASRVEVS